MRKRIVARTVERESPRWVENNIISAEQQEELMEFVLREAAEEMESREEKTVMQGLPAILIGLATVLLCVGIFLFYAANWRHMPSWLKLSQVFLLVGGLYGASFYVLAVRKGSELLGRALLILGMVSYGAGITLVAQIFHISAHPTNGVLAWAVGTLAMSWVMKERWGAYLTLFLVFVWGGWEASVYLHPNYLYLPVAALTIALFWRVQDRVGPVLVAASLLCWLGAWEGFWLMDLKSRFTDDVGLSLVLLTLPLGLLLVQVGRWLEQFDFFQWTGAFLRLVGWIGIFSPFIGLSWNFPIKSTYPLWEPQSRHLMIQFMVFFAISIGFSLERSLRLDRWTLYDGVLYGMTGGVLFLPFHNKTVLMVSTHLGLLVMMFGLILTSIRTERSQIGRTLGQVFVVVTLFAKFVGFFALGVKSKSFLLAYLVGFFVLATICFLANQFVKARVEAHEEELEYSGTLIKVVCALAGFVTLYSLSFKLPVQDSIFTLEQQTFVVLFTFLGIAVGLYAWLARFSEDKLPLGLSFLLFVLTVGVMFLARPSMGWIPYTILFNFLLFVMLGTLLWYSTRINSKALVNITLLAFVIVVTTRYFDLLWDALSGAALFLITGVLVMVGGTLLERNRRRLMETIEKHEKVERRQRWKESGRSRREEATAGEGGEE